MSTDKSSEQMRSECSYSLKKKNVLVNKVKLLKVHSTVYSVELGWGATQINFGARVAAIPHLLRRSYQIHIQWRL